MGRAPRALMEAAEPPVAMARMGNPSRAKQLGVTDQDYARLLEAQSGHCALCPSRPKTRRLHVDHDHASGRVRGLLCHRCNRGLPTWVTVEWLLRAACYLDGADDAMTVVERELVPTMATMQREAAIGVPEL